MRMLVALHELYSSPWRIAGDDVVDAKGIRITCFEGDDAGEVAFWTGIIEAINLLNTPETKDFLRGVELEAPHQRFRWGSDHDERKNPFDWYWTIGHLAQKAASAALLGDFEKARHHTISTAAVLANWHLRLSQILPPEISTTPAGRPVNPWRTEP
jgi:hypothetical protein